MAHLITEDCLACGACMDECPFDAISEGDIYFIDPSSCEDCGICAACCPMGAIVSTEIQTTPTISGTQLERDMAKYADDTFNKGDLKAGFLLLSEITGGIAIFGLIATALTSWLPGAGIPISSAMAAAGIKKIAEAYANLPTEDRRTIIKCANFLKRIV